MKPLNVLLAGVATGALVATTVLIAPVVVAVEAPLAPVTSDLRDISDDQPRWLSVPYSRAVINPFAFEEVGATTERTEIQYSGGADMPLSNGFYAHDEAIHVKNILNVYEQNSSIPQYLLDEDFNSQAETEAAGWQLHDAQASYADGRVTVTNHNAEWGFMRSPSIDYNPNLYPELTVNVPAVQPSNGLWALEAVFDGGNGPNVVKFQPDSSVTGELTIDLADILADEGRGGAQSFYIRLWSSTWETGSATVSVTFESIAIHQAEGSSGTGHTWVPTSATNVDYAWTPASVTMSGHFAQTDVTTEDYFSVSELDGLVRKITATGEDVFAAGSIEHANPTYDDATKTITTVGPYAARSVALPDDATVRFFDSAAQFRSAAVGTSAPSASTRYWSAQFPGDGTERYIGVGWAVVGQGDAATQSQLTAQAVRAEQDAGIDHWSQHWDGYMANAPALEDYSIQRVTSGGVESDRMRLFYYYAWINLEMNVLPATPETGNHYAQVGTGKPSLWMHGTPGTANVASWDSLLGMQQLVYTNPEASWDSFIGMMKSVTMDGPEPTDTNGVDAKGALKGESLPSRKAQTAWILYSVTGNQTNLEEIYEELHAHLIWESHNLRWMHYDQNFVDERDSEFVASLIYDLKFAVRIAELLDESARATQYQTLITSLTRDYEEWFFPTTSDGNGYVWPTVQKVFLDTSRTSIPDHPETEGQPYRDHKGRWVRQGLSYYTTTALVAEELGGEFKQKIIDRHVRDYDEHRQLAGLGRVRVKAPDVQLITYGLLDMTPFGNYTRSDLVDQATVLVNSYNRDMVIAKWFAEVYHETGNGAIGGHVKASGVRPSLFGISNYIDFMLIANGYRLDEGSPTFVRLEGASGGVSGLTHKNQKFSFDIDGTDIQLSGDAVGTGGLPPLIDASQTGISYTPDGNYQPDPTDPTDPTEPEPAVATSIVAPAAVQTTFGTSAHVSVNVRAANAVPQGRVEIRTGNLVVGSAQLVRGRATVSLSRDLAAGTHRAQVRYVPSSSSRYLAATKVLDVQVAKVKVGKVSVKITKPKKARTKIKRRTAATVRVRIASPHAADVTGRVQLRAGKRGLGKAKIERRGKRYVAVVKVKRKATQNIKRNTRITVRYLGDQTYLSSNHKTKLKVTKR